MTPTEAEDLRAEPCPICGPQYRGSTASHAGGPFVPYLTTLADEAEWSALAAAAEAQEADRLRAELADWQARVRLDRGDEDAMPADLKAAGWRRGGDTDCTAPYYVGPCGTVRDALISVSRRSVRRWTLTRFGRPPEVYDYALDAMRAAMVTP